jgi:hypothetical protein
VSNALPPHLSSNIPAAERDVQATRPSNEAAEKAAALECMQEAGKRKDDNVSLQKLHWMWPKDWCQLSPIIGNLCGNRTQRLAGRGRKVEAGRS